MSLEHVFETMRGLVTGALSQEEAAIRLYGEAASTDAERLGVYRRHYLWKTDTSTEYLFPITRRIILARIGKAGWEEITRIVGTEHPFPNIRFSTAGMVDVLAGPHAARLGLPRWLTELADLELCRSRMSDDEEPRQPPPPTAVLAVPSHLLVRSYDHDVNKVRRAEDPTAVDAPANPTFVVVWRTKQDTVGTGTLNPLDVRLILDVTTNGTVDAAALAAESGGSISSERVHQALARLLDVGLIRRVSPLA